MPKALVWLLVVLCAAGTAGAQGTAPAAAVQTETDEYTRYELLSPENASFAIRYEVTATTAGAKYYFNPIRKGSVASGESVVDVMTGEQLQFEVVSGPDAVKHFRRNRSAVDARWAKPQVTTQTATQNRK